MVKKIFFAFLLFLIFAFFCVSVIHAQTTLPLPKTTETFVKAKVIAASEQTTHTIDGYKTVSQKVHVQILDGSQIGKIISIEQESDSHFASAQDITQGQTVILDVITTANQTQYTITDIYRLPSLFLLAVIFFFLIILVAGQKGFGSIIGLSVSLLVIMFFIVPQILAQKDPLFISIIGSLIILTTTTYLAHGFSKQTSIAVLSTFLSLAATCICAILAVKASHLAGLGTEDSYLLQISPGQSINAQGLLLGGIVIGTLGALNDITTTQVAAITALFKQSAKLSFLELAEQGFLIGREHIASLVNTLVLAYAGASLTIFIFFVINPSHLPWWVIVNNESVAEEIVRTIAGSIGLILAVPITTFLATWFVMKKMGTKSTLQKASA